MRCTRFVLMLGLAFFCGMARAEVKTAKILAIGNSFSNNALRYFRDIVEASGNQVLTAHAMIGGCDFERHMRHADAFEANPDSPEGRPYCGGKKSLKELLTQDKWEYVTIQQVSHKSFKPETFHPHADRLIAYIKKYAPQAEIVIHQTWAYRDDHTFWGRKDFNTDVMYKGLRATYDGFAKETGLRIIPSGDAMEAARQDPAWGKYVPDPDFDPKTAVYPALPKNERRVLIGYCGWRKDAKTGTYTLAVDRFHAGTLGEYLLGCVWFEFFFGQSAVGNTFVPGNVTREDAAILQRIAHGVVTGKKRPEPKP